VGAADAASLMLHICRGRQSGDQRGASGLRRQSQAMRCDRAQRSADSRRRSPSPPLALLAPWGPCACPVPCSWWLLGTAAMCSVVRPAATPNQGCACAHGGGCRETMRQCLETPHVCTGCHEEPHVRGGTISCTTLHANQNPGGFQAGLESQRRLLEGSDRGYQQWAWQRPSRRRRRRQYPRLASPPAVFVGH
jgi:hypothetical protein